MASFTTPNPYVMALRNLEREREIPEAMAQQSMQPMQGQMVSGHYVAPSWTQGLSKLAQAYMAKKGMGRIDQEMQDTVSSRNKALAAALKEPEPISEYIRNPDYVAPPLSERIGAVDPDLGLQMKIANQARQDDFANKLRMFGLEQSVKPPTMREFRRGTENVTQEWNPQTGTWEDVASGAAFNPNPQTVINNAMSPIEAVDAEGNPVFAQPSKAGGEATIIPNIKPKPKEASYSPKEMQTARGKVQVAQRLKDQIRNARAKFDQIKGSFSAGFGQGWIPTEKGQQFDAAVDDLRSTVTALTRVPGVGAMSDFETRLDQAKIPSRGKYESVTEQQLQQLEALADGVIMGYSDILGETPAGQEVPQGVGSLEAPPEGIDPEDWKYMTPEERAMFQ